MYVHDKLGLQVMHKIIPQLKNFKGDILATVKNE